ncbi:MAG TPA: NAD(P)-dependent oxidoreductase [Burkholderiales bacterium]|nr:NAD(P)-dependent oxidoreductase [Burkholderiales bacterium]
MAKFPLSPVAVIGLGAMGRHMAMNLARAGAAVRGYDLRPIALSHDNIVVTQSAREALRGAAAVVTSLPDTPDVERALLGPGGAIEHLESGAIVIDTSTISPQATRQMAERLAARGIALIDAPVSGGVKGAEAATLTIMAGGEEAVFARARPVLEALGKTINYFGPSGAGQTVKLCNQIVCTMHIQAACEAFALAKANGVDLKKVRDALLGGAAGSWILQNHGPLMIEKDDTPHFRIDLQAKDLRLACELAASSKVPLPGANLVATLYYAAQAMGDGGRGNQSLYRVYDRLANQGEK